VAAAASRITAQAEHRVLLVHALHRRQQLALSLLALPTGVGDGQLDRQLGQVGQELVERRVDQPDRHRQAVHRLEDLEEVFALQGQQLGERVLLAGFVVRDDEVLHELPALAEEHVLGAAQADALGAEAARAGGVVGGVGVGAHLHPP
jgi:hypothetical protein